MASQSTAEIAMPMDGGASRGVGNKNALAHNAIGPTASSYRNALNENSGGKRKWAKVDR